MKGERKLSKKDLFYRYLRYGRYNLGHIPDSMISRTAIYESLVNCGIIKNLARKNKNGYPIYRVEKDFNYTENRHNRKRCTIHFMEGDEIIVDEYKRFWL